MDSRRKKRWQLALGAMTVQAAGAAYHLLVRPRMLVWGMTQQEARRPLPGDELEPDPVVNTTHAVTIDAPPSAIWPWIVQVGYGRAGWYTHDWVERLLFAGKYAEGHSATRIHPEFQDLRVGDHIYRARGAKWPVLALEPQRLLIIAGQAFVLQDLGDRRTRLIVRTRGPGYVRALFRKIPVLRELGAIIDYVVGEPLHHYMEKGMVLGIAERAEGRTRITSVARTPQPEATAL